MITLTSHFSVFSHYLGFISWKDPLEILFFSAILYRFSLWLKADASKPLLPLFYSYCCGLLGSFFFKFYTIHYFLLLYGPLLLTLLIVLHQELLQRNFVALKKIIPSKQTKNDNWLELLIRIFLRTKNHNKSILCVIEQQDTMANFIDAPFILQTPMQEHLLSLLLESPSYNTEKMIWLDKEGTLLAVNATWKNAIDKTWHSSELQEKDPYLANSFMITEKTDALIIMCNANTGTFDIIAQGKLVEHVSAANALRIIRHYLNYAPQSIKNGDKTYEAPVSKKSSVDQPFH